MPFLTLVVLMGYVVWTLFISYLFFFFIVSSFGINHDIKRNQVIVVIVSEAPSSLYRIYLGLIG